jgi:lipopolysaccharide export system protein LptC
MSALAMPLPTLRRLWDRLSIYLPVLLMGALALGSYWLLRATPMPPEPPPERAPSHEPDYYMREFAVKTFDVRGELQNELRGAEIRHYPDTDTLEVDEARIRSFNASGELTTARARRVTTNADQTVYELTGEAVVVRESVPRVEFRGEQLRILVQQDRIESSQPVLLIRGIDRITADRLQYDDASRQANLQGRVRATLAPR